MASPHNPMFDEHGRVWMTTQISRRGQGVLSEWVKSTIVTESNDPAISMPPSTSWLHAGTTCSSVTTIRRPMNSCRSIPDTTPITCSWIGRAGSDRRRWFALGMLDTKQAGFQQYRGTEVGAQKIWVRIDPATKKIDPGSGYGEAVNPVDGTVWYSSPQAGGPANKLYMVDPKTFRIKDYPRPEPGRFRTGITSARTVMFWTSLAGPNRAHGTKTGQWEVLGQPGLKFQGTRQGNRYDRLPLLPVGRSVQTSQGSARTPCSSRKHVGRDVRIRSKKEAVHHVPSAVPDAVLRARSGWPD